MNGYQLKCLKSTTHKLNPLGIGCVIFVENLNNIFSFLNLNLVYIYSFFFSSQWKNVYYCIIMNEIVCGDNGIDKDIYQLLLLNLFVHLKVSCWNV